MPCKHHDERRVAIKGVVYVTHECPPCPHGKVRGYRKEPPYHPYSRRLWHRDLDNLRCEDDHPNAAEVHRAAS